MARTNAAPKNTNRTFEGGPALPNGTPERQLRRAVASCLLWEDGFYEDGVAIADRIKQLVAQCSPAFVADLAVEARQTMKLRHAPLWLLACLFSKDRKPAQGLDGRISAVLRRADEPGELISLYTKAWPGSVRSNGATKDAVRLPAAMKRGIAKAMLKYDRYQLAKYDRKAAYSLKDVLRLVHPKPGAKAMTRDVAEASAENPEPAAALTQAEAWRQLIAGELGSADTWEVALSGGGDKKDEFTRLLQSGNLGYLALLRNLRNMVQAGVEPDLVRRAIAERKGAEMVLPFRYVAAARHAPMYEPDLDSALCASLDALPTLAGETAVLVDVSGSMHWGQLSGKSELNRIDAAATLASIIPGKLRVFVFNDHVREVPPRKGMAGVAAIKGLVGGGTRLGAAVSEMNKLKLDRLIVITDEESADAVPASTAKYAYMINVAQARNEVGYGSWTRIAGFSENVLKFIWEHERDVQL